MDLKGKRILIVDDEEDLCEILQYNLNNSGFITDVAHSAEEVLEKNLVSFDLFLLDVMMGPLSGFRLAERLRTEHNLDTPVIFLTARDTENDKLTGFSLGADDYVAKPFSINELTARIKAVLGRTAGEGKRKSDRLKIGDIELDNTKKRILIGNEVVDLTKKEYDILLLLMENSGKVFSREDILRLVWGNDVIVSDRTVDVNITRIRNKLGRYDFCIRNKTGFGYFFEL